MKHEIERRLRIMKPYFQVWCVIIYLFFLALFIPIVDSWGMNPDYAPMVSVLCAVVAEHVFVMIFGGHLIYFLSSQFDWDKPVE